MRTQESQQTISKLLFNDLGRRLTRLAADALAGRG